MLRVAKNNNKREKILERFDNASRLGRFFMLLFKPSLAKGYEIAELHTGIRGFLRIVLIPVRLSLLYYFWKGLIKEAGQRPNAERFWLTVAGLWIASFAGLIKLGVVGAMLNLFGGNIMLGALLIVNVFMAQILVLPAIVQLLGPTISNWIYDKKQRLHIFKSNRHLSRAQSWPIFGKSMTDEIWQNFKNDPEKQKENKLSWNLMIAGLSPLTDMTLLKSYDIFKEEMLDLLLLDNKAKEEFEKKIEEGDFLEYAKVFDHYYGTSKTFVEKSLNEKKHVVLVIDTQGALK